jgi:hypothetical protein
LIERWGLGCFLQTSGPASRGKINKASKKYFRMYGVLAPGSYTYEFAPENIVHRLIYFVKNCDAPRRSRAPGDWHWEVRRSPMSAWQVSLCGVVMSMSLAAPGRDRRSLFRKGRATSSLGSAGLGMLCFLPLARYLLKKRRDAVIASMWPFMTTCVSAHQLVRCRLLSSFGAQAPRDLR